MKRYQASLALGSAGHSRTFRVVPPGTGIIHQVNIEYLAKVVMSKAEANGNALAYLDSCVGTDSHTTTENGLGVLGWGVGGIEAEAAMLGQPISMLVPRVVGFKLTGSIPEGVTATDVVLTITDMLRKHGVVGKFVEFYGEGIASVPLANRATIGNMGPEFGSTCGIFPIDNVTLDYLRLTGRSEEQVALVEATPRPTSSWGDASDPDYVEPQYSEYEELRPRYRGAVHSLARSARRTAFCCPKPRACSRRPPRLRDREDRQGSGGRVHRLPWRFRHRKRRRGHRLDHLMHQHLQPVRDDRRRPDRPQRTCQGP